MTSETNYSLFETDIEDGGGRWLTHMVNDCKDPLIYVNSDTTMITDWMRFADQHMKEAHSVDPTTGHVAGY